MNEEVISLEDILYSLKLRWKMIVLITIFTTALAAGYSFYIVKPVYEGKTKVFIGKEGVAGTSTEYNNSDVTMYQNLMKTYGEIIKTKDSVKKALISSGRSIEGNEVSRVLSSLTVAPGADTQILDVTYKSKDKTEIVPILNAITNTFMVSSKELIPNGNIKIIQSAEEPKSPVSPNKVMNIAIGFLLGLMVSIGIVFLMEYLNNTIKKEEELETLLKVPVVGVIPKVDESQLGKRRRKK